MADYIRDWPVEIKYLIACRMVMRSIPMISGLPAQCGSHAFRACLVLWGMAYGKVDSAYIKSASLSVGLAIRDADAIVRMGRAGIQSVYHDTAASEWRKVASRAIKAIRYALDLDLPGASYILSNIMDRDLVWSAVNYDLSYLYKMLRQCKLGCDGKESPSRILFAPIWPDGVPAWLSTVWENFKLELDNDGKEYQAITRWYDGIFYNRESYIDLFGPQMSLRIAHQEERWWVRPTVVINSEISHWLLQRELAIANINEELSAVPDQRPAGAVFIWDNGLLSAFPSSVSSHDFVDDFLVEAKQKSEELAYRLVTTNVAPRVLKSLENLIKSLPETSSELRPAMLRSSARSVHADAAAYAAQFQAGELPADALAMMIDLSACLRDLEACYPELKGIEKEIADLNLQPRDVTAVQVHLGEVNEVIAVSPVVAEEAKKVVADGGAAMVADAAGDIQAVRTAEQALIIRNLAWMAVRGSLAEILSRVPKTAGRVYDETEKASLNLIRPVASVGASLLVSSLAGPLAGLALFALAEYERLPGVINFIKEARKNIIPDDESGP